jgi:hypothetical protein
MTNTSSTFLTPETIGTYGGASFAVLVISNTLRKLFKIDSVWPGIIIALLTSYIGAFASKPFGWNMADIYISLANGCMLFTNAAGIQEVSGNVFKIRDGNQYTELHSKMPVKFWSSWFKR